MLETLFWVAVGLVVGWNLLPQPAWAKALWDICTGKYLAGD